MKHDEIVRLIVGKRALRAVLHRGQYGDPTDTFRLVTLQPVPQDLGDEFRAELDQQGRQQVEVNLVNSVPGCRQAWAMILV